MQFGKPSKFFFKAIEIDGEKRGFNFALNFSGKFSFRGINRDGILKNPESDYCILTDLVDEKEESFKNGIVREYDLYDKFLEEIPSIYAGLSDENEKSCFYFAMTGFARYIIDRKRAWFFKLSSQKMNSDAKTCLHLLAKGLFDTLDKCANENWNPKSNYLDSIAGKDWEIREDLDLQIRIDVLKHLVNRSFGKEPDEDKSIILYKGKLYWIKSKETLVAKSLCKPAGRKPVVDAMNGVLAMMLEDALDLEKNGIYSVLSKFDDGLGNEYYTIVGPDGDERKISSSKIELLTLVS